MNILFVYSLDVGIEPNKVLDYPDRMSFGISYISSVLKERGHNTELLVLSRLFGRENKDDIADCVNRFQPELMCFSAVFTQYDFIASIARYIARNYPRIYLVIGGPHATASPNDVSLADFDALCVGEGESPVYELVLQLEENVVPSGIPNLWIRHGSKIEKNAPRPFLDNLDGLPFPDRAMWQKWMPQKVSGHIPVLVSRGCPFNCSYCCNHVFKQIAKGRYVRLRSPKSIVEEIRSIVRSVPTVKGIYLESETIVSVTHWILELCAELESMNKELPHALSFGANIRIARNIAFKDIFAAFRRSNFRFINIGVESGSEKVRREILKRDYSNADIVRTVELAREFGLQVCFFNLIGIPGETIEDFKETVRINQVCKPDWHLTSIFYPYPGTELHRLCKQQGLLDKLQRPEFRQERQDAICDLPGFSKKQIQLSYRLFDHYIRKGIDPEEKPLTLTIMLLKIKLGECLWECYARWVPFKCLLRYVKKRVMRWRGMLLL